MEAYCSLAAELASVARKEKQPSPCQPAGTLLSRDQPPHSAPRLAVSPTAGLGRAGAVTPTAGSPGEESSAAAPEALSVHEGALGWPWGDWGKADWSPRPSGGALRGALLDTGPLAPSWGAGLCWPKDAEYGGQAA